MIAEAKPSSAYRDVFVYAFVLFNFRFRHLLSQEAATHSVNQSLVAIREHGILISDVLKNGYQPFWVIGYVILFAHLNLPLFDISSFKKFILIYVFSRLFTNPSKEVYVCHRADVPQNLVEIAYRLTFHTAG